MGNFKKIFDNNAPVVNSVKGDYVRNVNLVSIGFDSGHQNLNSICAIVEQQVQDGVDLVLLPEMCLAYELFYMDGKEVKAMSELAARKNVYIVFTSFFSVNNENFNRSVMFDRGGEIAGIYDKAFTFFGEGFLDPPCVPGKEIPVFKTDFGVIGISNCFDVNFPQVYKKLSDQNAEIVLYPSGYTAGMSLQAHAINHNYYIVSSTLKPDCLLYDISGREAYYKTTPGVNISPLTIDLDRCIFHFDYNLQKRDRLLKENADIIEQDSCFEREGWFTLKSKKPGVSARQLASDYCLEELSQYKKRKADELNELRGFAYT